MSNCGAQLEFIHAGLVFEDGPERLRALRTFYADDALQAILRDVLSVSKDRLNRYERGLLRCMRLRMAAATRLWMRLLELRTAIFARAQKGGRA